MEARAKRRSSGGRSRETKNKFEAFSGLGWRCERATSRDNPTASPKRAVEHLLKLNRSVIPYLRYNSVLLGMAKVLSGVYSIHTHVPHIPFEHCL